MIHGIAGYQCGCRCRNCIAAETTRTQHIAQSERARWSQTNRDADQQWDNSSTRASRKAQTPDAKPRRQYRRWTVAQIGVAANPSLTDQQVAARTGRSLKAVRHMRNRII